MLSNLMNQILMMKRVISRQFGRSKKIIHGVTDVSFPMEVNGEKSFWCRTASRDWCRSKRGNCNTVVGHYIFLTSTVGAVPGGLSHPHIAWLPPLLPFSPTSLLRWPTEGTTSRKEIRTSNLRSRCVAQTDDSVLLIQFFTWASLPAAGMWEEGHHV